MEKQQFWSIIGKSSQEPSGNRDTQLATLRRELEALTPDEIVGFQRCFDECLAEAYHWDLWGAAYVIGQGCSDDGFQDFRAWLISKGEAVYRKALKDPDTLVESVADSDDACQFEEFQYVASQVWEQKTRKDLRARNGPKRGMT